MAIIAAARAMSMNQPSQYSLSDEFSYFIHVLFRNRALGRIDGIPFLLRDGGLFQRRRIVQIELLALEPKKRRRRSEEFGYQLSYSKHDDLLVAQRHIQPIEQSLRDRLYVRLEDLGLIQVRELLPVGVP